MRKENDTLADYLARCSLAYILDRDKQTLPKLLEDEVNHLSCDKLNLLDQQFRRHFNWRTLELLHEELLESLKNNTASHSTKIVSLMWPNGYIREAALQHVNSSSDSLSIKLLMLRLNDWVTLIPEQSCSKLIDIIPTISTEDATDLIPYTARLLFCGRTMKEEDFSIFRDLLIHKLGTDQIANILSSSGNLHTYKRPLAELLWTTDLCGKTATLKALLTTNDPFIRFKTLRETVPTLPSEEQVQLVLDLPPTKWVPARIERLKILQSNQAQELRKELITALTDNSAAPRQFARFYLRKEDFPIEEHYLQTFKSNDPTVTINALKGLAEIESVHALPVIEQWLQNNDPKKLSTALYLIKLTDSKNHIDTIVQALSHQANQVKRAAFYAGRYISDKEHFLPLINSSSVSDRTKVYAAKSFLQSESWLAFDAALRFLSHDISKIRTMANTFLQRFCTEIPFSKPSAKLSKSISEYLNDPSSDIPQNMRKFLQFATHNHLTNS